MYKYKIVEVEARGILLSGPEEYKGILDRHANEGWRFVQILPSKYASNAIPTKYQIIFEKEQESL